MYSKWNEVSSFPSFPPPTNPVRYPPLTGFFLFRQDFGKTCQCFVKIYIDINSFLKHRPVSAFYFHISFQFLHFLWAAFRIEASIYHFGTSIAVINKYTDRIHNLSADNPQRIGPMLNTQPIGCRILRVQKNMKLQRIQKS
jgi:hypothetical protein